MVVKPSVALVGTPAPFASAGSAKKARKTLELASTRSSFCGIARPS